MEELDVIELLSPVGSWPAGTTGTIVILDEARPDWMMVEIVSEEDGSALDTIEVRPDQAKVVWAIKDHGAPPASDGITVRAAVTRSPRR
jgi:hypothetical protein